MKEAFATLRANEFLSCLTRFRRTTSSVKATRRSLILFPFVKLAENIGVGRFRILGGPRFRILGGGARGDQIPNRHMRSY